MATSPSQFQIGAPIGDGALISPSKNDSSSNQQSSGLSSTAFGYTRDISTLRARLKVINAALYTDDYLNAMTKNDMVYALGLSL